MATKAPTALIHHPYRPPEGFDSPQPGIFKASSVFFPNVAAMRSREWKDKTSYTYGLHGTPSSYMLEERLCTLEGGLQCVLAPSGLAALALVSLSMLRAGDEVLLPENVYEPNKSLVEAELKNWGITHQFYDPMDLADLEAKLSNKTRLVWLEAAGSVTLEFPDVPAMVRLCHARGICTALDNTWGAGIAFNPFDLLPGMVPPLGVDISTQALTKYPSGGGDVLMGSVITRDPALHMRIKLTHMRLGLNVGPNDVELVLRALPSIYLRYQAHDASTRAVATWCQSQPEFTQVLHPALPGSPGHAHWRSLCTTDATACLFSVVLDTRFSLSQVDAFVDALRLFRLAYSWAGPISLVVPYDLARSRGRWPAQVARGTVVRFAVGLEDPQDLQADIAQALALLRT
jgi:cystathionine beta-lyase